MARERKASQIARLGWISDRYPRILKLCERIDELEEQQDETNKQT